MLAGDSGWLGTAVMSLRASGWRERAAAMSANSTGASRLALALVEPDCQTILVVLTSNLGVDATGRNAIEKVAPDVRDLGIDA
jgi:hypothetical protein